jgi:Fic family protein
VDVVWYLLQSGVLSEPSLTVSPWFEARRGECYDRLLAISTRGDWDSFLRFFAEGLAASATQTRSDILTLLGIQAELHDIVAGSSLRADSAHKVVDVAITHPTFTVRDIQDATGVTHARASRLISQLSDLGILMTLNHEEYQRRYYAPKVLVMLARQGRLGEVG